STSASASALPFQSTWYSESEITQGARSRSQNQQRDHDSKRPKLSCTNCTSTSAGRSVGHGLNAVSDSSWRHSQVPRSSSVVLGSFGTDLMRERRADSSISNLMDYSHRSGHPKLLRDFDFFGEDGVCHLLAKIIALSQIPKILTKNLKVEIQDHGYLPHLEIDAHLCSLEGGERDEMNLQGYLPLIYHLDLIIFLEENQMKWFTLKHRVIPLGLLPADHKHLQHQAVLLRGAPYRIRLTVDEDSEEEEGDLCRICQMAAASSSNLLIEPCKCTGSLQYVHQECMKKWLQAKINSGSSLEAVTTCELCKEKLQLNLEDFDIHELHRAHANEQAEYEFISSGLYLVVLLHLCEQSFSDMMGNTNEPSTRVRFINLARTLQAHMEDLESRWNFPSPDLLNLLLQIKPTEQNLSPHGPLIGSQLRQQLQSLKITFQL
ncbi:hypothetical protein EI555_006967, partial [Monodon monoceros]